MELSAKFELMRSYFCPENKSMLRDGIEPGKNWEWFKDI